MGETLCTHDSPERVTEVGGCIAPVGSECCYSMAIRCRMSKACAVIGLSFTALATATELVRANLYTAIPVALPFGFTLAAALGYLFVVSLLLYSYFGPALIHDGFWSAPIESGTCGFSGLETATQKVNVTLSVGFYLLVAAYMLSVVQAGFFDRSRLLCGFSRTRDDVQYTAVNTVP